MLFPISENLPSKVCRDVSKQGKGRSVLQQKENGDLNNLTIVFKTSIIWKLKVILILLPPLLPFG